MDKLEHLFQLQKLFGSKFTNFDMLTEIGKQEKTLEFIDHMIEELAQAVLDCLAGQKAYFDCPHGDPNKQVLLLASKDREGRLKKFCRDLLTPPAPDLFDGEKP